MATPQLQQQQVEDPIGKFKIVYPMMKKTLQTLMELAAQIFHQNSNVDTCSNRNETQPFDRFDKCLEEFYAQCDQIEVALRLALECHGQAVESMRNAPVYVPLIPNAPNKPPGADQQEPLTYSQYLSLTRSQVSFAREIHSCLQECVRKMNEHHESLGVMQAPSSVGTS